MHWTDVEEIAEALEEQHPAQDLYAIRFTDLREWVMKIDGFAGDPTRCNEKILEAIQAAWFALRAGE
jgi:FeS assembly protein IscX